MTGLGHGHGHGHGHGAWSPSSAESSRAGIRAAWLGLAGMTVTAALQVVIVAVSGSIGLLADTLHNVGHAVTTIPLLMAFRLGQRAPTRCYPYGFRRAEDLVGLLIAAVVAASAVLIVVEAVRALLSPPELSHLGWVFAAGVVGAVGNEAVAVHRIRVGRRIGSAALVAEGHHARVDGLTSVAVVLGVVGTWLGFARADAVVGLCVGAVVTAILVGSLRTTVRRLMDGVEPGVVAHVADVAAQTPGVVSVDGTRARWTGHRLETDLVIGVAADLSVSSAHDIATDVEHRLVREVAHLERAVVHLALARSS